MVNLKKLVHCLADSKSKSEAVAFWPLHPAVFIAGLLPDFPNHFIATIDKAKEKGLTDEEIAQRFYNPSRISNFLHLLHTASFFNWDIPQRQRFATDIVKYMSYYRKDPYCTDWTNIILDKEGIVKAFKETDKADSQTKDFSGMLNTLMFEYTELIFIGTHYLGHEFHGPYPCGDNQFLIVREYYDLKPEYWEITKEFSFNRIKTFEVYKDVDIKFDVFNHEISSGQLPSHLQGYAVFIEGEKIHISDFSKILNQIKNYWLGIADKINLEDREYVKKAVESFYWVIKPDKEAIGEDWKPSKLQYDHISKLDIEGLKEKGSGGESKTRIGKSQEEKYKILKNMFRFI